MSPDKKQMVGVMGGMRYKYLIDDLTESDKPTKQTSVVFVDALVENSLRRLPSSKEPRRPVLTRGLKLCLA
jgi:hypothetical protein